MGKNKNLHKDTAAAAQAEANATEFIDQIFRVNGNSNGVTDGNAEGTGIELIAASNLTNAEHNLIEEHSRLAEYGRGSNDFQYALKKLTNLPIASTFSKDNVNTVIATLTTFGGNVVLTLEHQLKKFKNAFLEKFKNAFLEKFGNYDAANGDDVLKKYLDNYFESPKAKALPQASYTVLKEIRDSALEEISDDEAEAAKAEAVKAAQAAATQADKAAQVAQAAAEANATTNTTGIPAKAEATQAEAAKAEDGNATGNDGKQTPATVTPATGNDVPKGLVVLQITQGQQQSKKFGISEDTKQFLTKKFDELVKFDELAGSKEEGAKKKIIAEIVLHTFDKELKPIFNQSKVVFVKSAQAIFQKIINTPLQQKLNEALRGIPKGENFNEAIKFLLGERIKKLAEVKGANAKDSIENINKLVESFAQSASTMSSNTNSALMSKKAKDAIHTKIAKNQGDQFSLEELDTDFDPKDPKLSLDDLKTKLSSLQNNYSGLVLYYDKELKAYITCEELIRQVEDEENYFMETELADQELSYGADYTTKTKGNKKLHTYSHSQIVDKSKMTKDSEENISKIVQDFADTFGKAELAANTDTQGNKESTPVTNKVEPKDTVTTSTEKLPANTDTKGNRESTPVTNKVEPKGTVTTSTEKLAATTDTQDSTDETTRTSTEEFVVANTDTQGSGGIVNAPDEQLEVVGQVVNLES